MADSSMLSISMKDLSKSAIGPITQPVAMIPLKRKLNQML